MQIYLTWLIIAAGVFLFIKNYFSIDTTSILIMSLFIISGVLSPEEGFSGFNHPATVTLGCMFVISAAIFKSGIIEGISAPLIRVAKLHYLLSLSIFCVVAATFSAFINDAAVVALLIPIVLKVCRETKIKPSKLLLPISFSALFGGTCTLIGTSTNILVSSYAEKHHIAPFGMFELSQAALCLLAVGLIYIIITSYFLLPARSVENDKNLVKNAEKYIAEVQIPKDSKDHQRKIKEANLIIKYSAQVISIYRNNYKLSLVDGSTVLLAGDTLKILIGTDELSHLKDSKLYLFPGEDKDYSLTLQENEDKKLYEVIIPVSSDLVGYSLKQLRFRNNYHVSVLAIRHRNETILHQIADIKLTAGDVLLLFAHQQEINFLVTDKKVMVLSEFESKKINYKKAIPAIAITVAVVTVAALNLTSILISAMVGCLLLITTSILKPQEAYEAIEWKVIFMMAGVLSMGKALEVSGGAQQISTFVTDTVGSLHPQITLSIIFLITFLSTNILSSKATAALMAPVVISLAGGMHISEKPFLVAVMFACSLTFMSPLSYPTNTMVFTPGNYKFKDYLLFGTPLNLMIWILASFIIPHFFPF